MNSTKIEAIVNSANLPTQKEGELRAFLKETGDSRCREALAFIEANTQDPSALGRIERMLNINTISKFQQTTRPAPTYKISSHQDQSHWEISNRLK